MRVALLTFAVRGFVLAFGLACAAHGAVTSSTPAPLPACWDAGSLRVLIAYASDTGHTAALAREVALGAATVPEVCVVSADVATLAPDIVRDADAILLGSGVHNANPSARLLAWIERWPFRGAPLFDKVGAVFVTAGGTSAGEEVTQLALLHAMLEFGMVVLGGADWQAAFGASAVQGEPLDAAVAMPVFNARARQLGARVVAFASRLRGATRQNLQHAVRAPR